MPHSSLLLLQYSYADTSPQLFLASESFMDEASKYKYYMLVTRPELQTQLVFILRSINRK